MRVVVVDPSRTVLKFIARLLATRNHEMRTFVAAREALECVRSDLSVGALITSDELLPMSEMSGIELCWEARLLATCRRPIYIILMSCDRDQHKLIEALDRVAEEVATENAITGRLGGEEFGMLLEGRDLAGALRMAEDLRTRISAMRVQTEKQRLKLTCSFGVSEWEPGDTIDRLLKRADIALYSAKSSGRDRVVAFDPELIAAINCSSLSGRARSAAR